MNDRQIQRMNFIGRKGLVLDYQHIVFILIAWFLFLVLITGIEHVRLWYAQRSIQKGKSQLAALMQDQERRLAMMQLSGPRLDKAKQQDLIAMFESPPRWSRVLDDLQGRIPPHVRITQVRSSEDIKEGRFGLRIEGVAPSMHSIVEFMQRVQASPMFRNVSLTEAKRSETDSRVFSYGMEMQVLVVGG